MCIFEISKQWWMSNALKLYFWLTSGSDFSRPDRKQEFKWGGRINSLRDDGDDDEHGKVPDDVISFSEEFSVNTPK